VVYRAYIYRLYPTKSQEVRLDSVRETCRRFYNDCLSQRKTSYEETKETTSKYAQLRKVRDLKATNPFAKEVHSHILQVVVDDLDKAFPNFFRRVKAGDTPGYPRFKGRNRFAGFGLKELNNGFRIDGRRLKLSGIGRIALRWHRPIEGTIKRVRIIQKAGKWYAAFAVLSPLSEALPQAGESVGVDVGIASLLTTSTGERVENPRWYRTEQQKLRVVQRRVARRKIGGSNRRKAVRQLQKQHERIANRRKDYCNKLAHGLIQRYDTIALENLRITNMVRNHHLSKSILDAGWGYLVTHLTHKAEEAGRRVILVDPAYTSKTCSRCGALFEHLTLADRWVICPCGLSLDRDHNAAINILKRAGTPPLGANVAKRQPSGCGYVCVAQEAAGL